MAREEKVMGPESRSYATKAELPYARRKVPRTSEPVGRRPGYASHAVTRSTEKPVDTAEQAVRPLFGLFGAM